MAEKLPPLPKDPDEAYREAERRIAAAKQSGQTELQLAGRIFSRSGLRKIPPAIAELTALTSLDLESTEVSDLTPLAGLTSLTSLYLNSTKISTLAPLASLTSLTQLNLHGTSVTDLTPLAGLTSLTELYLAATEVTDLTPLAGLTSLTQLNLESTEVSDLAPLAGFTSLTSLDLESTEVSDLAPLAGFTSLTSLDLAGTRVSDLAPLAGLTSLTQLDLRRAKIGDLAILSHLPAFWQLSDAARLNFAHTPYAESDNKLMMIASLNRGHEIARQLVQFLKGEHPDFNTPEAMLVRSPAEIDAALRLAAPAEIRAEGSRLVAAPNPAYGPPEREDPAEQARLLDMLRPTAHALAGELANKQVPSLVARLNAYHQALIPADYNYLTANNIALGIRGDVGDDYITDNLTGGDVNRLQDFLAQHDRLAAYELSAEESRPQAPEPRITHDDPRAEAAREAIKKAGELLEAAQEDELLDQSIIDAYAPGIDMSQDARPGPDDDAAKREQRARAWSRALKLGTGILLTITTAAGAAPFFGISNWQILVQELEQLVAILRNLFL